jgi:hypothetical protein
MYCYLLWEPGPPKVSKYSGILSDTYLTYLIWHICNREAPVVIYSGLQLTVEATLPPGPDQAQRKPDN